MDKILSIRFILQTILIAISVIICALLLMLRIRGMELAGVTPNWFLIWLIIWSVKRNLWQSLVAAISLGLVWDSITGIYPSHVLGFIVVSLFTNNVYDRKYIKEDLISIMLIVFGMSIIYETITALQYSLQTEIPLVDVWLNYQKNYLASSVLSSLWTPLVYFISNYHNNFHRSNL